MEGAGKPGFRELKLHSTEVTLGLNDFSLYCMSLPQMHHGSLCPCLSLCVILSIPCSLYHSLCLCISPSILQGDQQSSRAEAGRRDPHHVPQANRQHRPHLLRLLHHLWYSWCSGKYHQICIQMFSTVQLIRGSLKLSTISEDSLPIFLIGPEMVKLLQI